MFSLHSSIGCTQHGHSIGARCTTCNNGVRLLIDVALPLLWQRNPRRGNEIPVVTGVTTLHGVNFDNHTCPWYDVPNSERAKVAVSQAPTFIEEERLRVQGYRFIAGVDEVGRGPLAGPVVAAAAILPLEDRPSWLHLLRDSKQLTPQRREFLFDCIQKDGISFGVGIVSHEVVDEQGIVAATRLAMRYAVDQLPGFPDFLLLDFVRLPDVRISQKSIVNGDGLCLSIAAASIIAKVTRDRIMVQLDRQFPGYGLVRNKGYGTPEHIEGLQRLGPCPLHRRTFAPVRAVSSDAGVASDGVRP